MKKTTLCCGLAAAVLALASCSKNNGTDYEGTNYIYLSTEGNTTIFEADDTPLVVDIELTKALEEDLTLTFTTSDNNDVVNLQDNPVTIKAGEKKASLNIVSNLAGKLDETTSYKLSLDSSCKLPEGVALKSDFAFSVTPVVTGTLTEEQQAIVDAYKVATDIDISKYLGFVNVSTVYTGSDLETGEPLEPETITGKSIIALSDKSTLEAPVLVITANPMGIQDKMYRSLRAVTVESEFWLTPAEDSGVEDFATLMNTITWNSESTENFSMSLDGITLAADKSVSFVGDGVDQYGDSINIVPFGYSFSAYDRELAAIADGTLVKGDEWYTDATANPAYHLNISDITEDMYELEGEGNWIAPTATITAESLVFTFCADVYGASDYFRVVATYTPNK